MQTRSVIHGQVPAHAGLLEPDEQTSTSNFGTFRSATMNNATPIVQTRNRFTNGDDPCAATLFEILLPAGEGGRVLAVG